MVARAMDRGVSSADIAAALNLQIESVLRRFRLLERISPEAAEMLKDTPCSISQIARHQTRRLLTRLKNVPAVIHQMRPHLVQFVKRSLHPISNSVLPQFRHRDAFALSMLE